MNTKQTKICLSCADTGKFKFNPCPNHSPLIDPTTCEHTLTSHTITHNGENDGIICHSCGNFTKKAN